MTYFPPTQGPGRPFGEPTPRINEQELREEAQRHEADEERQSHDAPRPGFFTRLFRKRPKATSSETD